MFRDIGISEIMRYMLSTLWRISQIMLYMLSKLWIIVYMIIPDAVRQFCFTCFYCYMLAQESRSYVFSYTKHWTIKMIFIALISFASHEFILIVSTSELVPKFKLELASCLNFLYIYKPWQ